MEHVLLAGLYIFYFRRYMQDVPDYAPVSMKRIMKRTLRLLVVAYIFVFGYEVFSLTLL